MSDASPVVRSGRDPVATRQRWADRLQRFRTSGQSVAAFCAAEGVSAPTFYQWKRQLTSAAPPVDAPTIVPLHISASIPTASGVEVVLASGTLIRLPADTRPEVLVAILRGVEDRPC